MTMVKICNVRDEVIAELVDGVGVPRVGDELHVVRAVDRVGNARTNATERFVVSRVVWPAGASSKDAVAIGRALPMVYVRRAASRVRGANRDIVVRGETVRSRK
jgi:hypothetical protein